VGALEQLRREGKIAAIGLSNVTIAQLDAALTVAPVASVQNQLSYGDPRDLPTALASMTCAERDGQISMHGMQKVRASNPPGDRFRNDPHNGPGRRSAACRLEAQ